MSCDVSLRTLQVLSVAALLSLWQPVDAAPGDAPTGDAPATAAAAPATADISY